MVEPEMDRFSLNRSTVIVLGLLLGLAALSLLGIHVHGCATVHEPQGGRQRDLQSDPKENTPATSHTVDRSLPHKAASSQRKPPIEHVMVMVVDELTSRPILGAQILSSGLPLSQTDAQGKAPVARQVLSSGVRIVASGYMSRNVSSTSASIDVVRVLLEPDALGAGVVVDEAGNGLGEVHVSIRSHIHFSDCSPVSGGLFETATSTDGTFQFPVSNRNRTVFATDESGKCGTAEVPPGVAAVRVLVRDGAQLEVILEGDLSLNVATLELAPQALRPELQAASRYCQPVESGRAKFVGLTPRSDVELSSPDLPGALWTAVLGNGGTTTRILIVIDSGTVQLHLNWTESPIHPAQSIQVGLSRGTFRAVGRFMSADTIELPSYFAPFPRTLQLRLLDAAGVVVGQAFESTFRRVAEDEFECDVHTAATIAGTVVDFTGAPVAGALVTLDNSVMPVHTAVSQADGVFELVTISRWDFSLVATYGAASAEVTYPAGTRVLGDVMLQATRTVRVHLAGSHDDTQYFVSAWDVGWISGWPAPQACRVGESVDVAVRPGTKAMIVRGPDRDIVEAISQDTVDVTIQTDREGVSIRLKAALRLADGGELVPLAGARFKIGLEEPRSLSEADRVQAGTTRYAVTDEDGEVAVDRLPRGSVRIELISPSMDGFAHPAGLFRLTNADQTLTYVLNAIDEEPGYVFVMGRIGPAPSSPTPALLCLDKPLPQPMDARTIKGSGIHYKMVKHAQALAGGYTARMHEEYPYVAVRVDDELGLYDNAGYVTRIGDMWRADLVIPPPPHDRATATLTVDTSESSISMRLLKVLWVEEGKMRGYGKPFELGREVEVMWPRTAERVWVVATADASGRRLAAMLEPRQGSSNTLTLEVMPPISLINTDGVSGWLALTPQNMMERDWISLSKSNSNGLTLYGAGIYELAGRDSNGKVRSLTINVQTGMDTLELDAAAVLSEP
ncbi:MAG: carboxypeptidase regulatory-like domain-containing protein [Planctomycetes bacterium]|nr:carboxypeptidase regulatory-like domain-containing protein [Planctomycetota bacterium]